MEPSHALNLTPRSHTSLLSSSPPLPSPQSVGLFGGSSSNYDNGYDSDYYNNYNRGLGRGGYDSYDRPYGGRYSRRSGGYSSYDRPYGQYSRRNGMSSYDRGFNSFGPYETGYNDRGYSYDRPYGGQYSRRSGGYSSYDRPYGQYSRRNGISTYNRGFNSFGPYETGYNSRRYNNINDYDYYGGGGYDRYRMGGGSRGFGPYSSSYGGYGGGGGYDGYRMQQFGGSGYGNYPQYNGYSQYGGNSMGYNGMTQYGVGNQFGYGTSMY